MGGSVLGLCQVLMGKNVLVEQQVVSQRRRLRSVAHAVGVQVNDALARPRHPLLLVQSRRLLGRRRVERESTIRDSLGLVHVPARREPSSGRLGDGGTVRRAELVDVRSVNEPVLAGHVLEEAVIVQLLGPDDGLVDGLDVPARLVAEERARESDDQPKSSVHAQRFRRTHSQSTSASLVNELGCWREEKGGQHGSGLPDEMPRGKRT